MLYDLIEDQKKQIEILIDQEKSARAELESRRQSVQVITEAYKKKKARLTVSPSDDEENTVYKRDLIVLEEQLHRYKKEQEELGFKEIEIKSSIHCNGRRL